jgi:hypothetical protein
MMETNEPEYVVISPVHYFKSIIFLLLWHGQQGR